MDTPTHALQGGLVYALPAKFLFMVFSINCPAILWILFMWGLIEGAWPDVYPWILYKFKGATRWDGYYRIYHHAVETTVWRYFPAFRLHVSVVDPPFHEGNGGNWWPSMWKTCVRYWAATLVLLTILIVG